MREGKKMKTFTNKKELKSLNACRDGYVKFIEAHGDNDAKLSECLDSNGWDDVWWLISNTYEQLTDEQKYDLRVYGCKKALINIEKIKPYCSADDYKTITGYLNDPKESAESAAWSAAESAESAAWSAAESAAWSAARSAAWSARSARSAAESARSARSAAESARSAAESAAWSAAESAAWSAAMKEFTQELKELFIKWESKSE